jgi:hypothetical protein
VPSELPVPDAPPVPTSAPPVPLPPDPLVPPLPPFADGGVELHPAPPATTNAASANFTARHNVDGDLFKFVDVIVIPPMFTCPCSFCRGQLASD